MVLVVVIVLNGVGCGGDGGDSGDGDHNTQQFTNRFPLNLLQELFTVLIIGPEDTPYEDGVFVFDIKLPPNYPAIPPSVFFVSMTTTPLNPNLYVDGNVCTSLLGTWPGKDSESWTEKSNMLQVLLSIQGSYPGVCGCTKGV